MSFSYDSALTPLNAVRMLIADTDSTAPIFADDEINRALYLESSQALYISSQASPTAMNLQIPYVPQVYSVYRAAALLLDAIAANRSRLQNVIQLLDVKLSTTSLGNELRAQAKQYREVEANSGSFAIAEMVQNDFSARERLWKSRQRTQG